MSFAQIVWFAIALNVTAAAGAFGFAWIDDAIGARRTILITLAGLMGLGTAVLLVREQSSFWWLAVGLGTFVGPAQAAGRSLLARMAPPEMVTEMFGLYNLTGKAAAFMGPLALGLATDWFQSQRAGMATIVGFFLAGFILMLGVREPPAPVA
jgi:UMF1 family MFS transporter